MCVRFVCVLGVVKHPDYLHDSTELWNFKEPLHESFQHVLEEEGVSYTLCQAETGSKWAAGGWWKS